MNTGLKRDRRIALRKVRLQAAAVGAVLLMAGCAEKPQESGIIVVPKEGKTEYPQDVSQSEQNIAKQVQAPELWQTCFSDGGITVRVDAPVVIPDAAGVSPQKIRARVFSREDYDEICRVVLDGQGALLYTKKADAAEERDVSALFAGDYDTIQYMVQGYAEADQEHWVSIDNGLYRDPKWRDIYMEVFLSRYYENGYRVPSPSARETYEGRTGISAADFERMAEKLVKELGLEEYRVADSEFVMLGGDEQEKPACLVHFTRVIDGVWVNYRKGFNGWIASYDVKWRDERLDTLFSEEGLVGIVWENPCAVETECAEYVKLLSFAQIQDIFMKMMLKKYEGMKGSAEPAEFEISEIRFGYIRSREERDAAEAALIPAWDFYGVLRQDDGTGDTESSFYSWLTINAVDGTVIER